MTVKKEKTPAFIMLAEIVIIVAILLAFAVQNFSSLDAKYETYGLSSFNNTEIDGFIEKYKEEKTKELESDNENGKIYFSFSELRNKGDICIVRAEAYKVVEEGDESVHVVLDSDDIWISKTGETYKLTVED